MSVSAPAPSSPRIPALPAARWARIGRALREIADPLAHASTEAWLAAVGEAVREVVGATAVTVFGPGDPRAPVASSYPAWVFEASREYETEATGRRYETRALAAGVATRRELVGPDYEAFAASPYVREFLPAVGACDALTIAAGEAADAAVLLILNVDDPTRPFTADDVALARLLRPALEAGLAAERAVGTARADLAAAVGAAGQACVVFDADGRRIHLSAALDAVLAAEPEREALLALADEMARDGRAAAAFEGAHVRYDLAASRAVLGGRPARLVAVAPPLSRARRLTPRQAEVAGLLAQRLSNREIAEVLAVSPHTSRHHTEAVMRVLGVSDRRAVAAALKGRRA